MKDHEGLDKLFFELASESRLGILRELQVKGLRMQEIARTLDITDTETCRQLQRLGEARLIQKQPNGTYELTTYAKLVLDIASPLEFISRYKEYFLVHNAFLLPIESWLARVFISIRFWRPETSVESLKAEKQTKNHRKEGNWPEISVLDCGYVFVLDMSPILSIET